MFTTLDKALIALVMAVLAILNQVFGIVTPSFMTEGNITMIITALTPLLVYLMPNKKPTSISTTAQKPKP
jgi:predicted ABC-type sugar transport system permease subunit